jgi:hypothetical protein
MSTTELKILVIRFGGYVNGLWSTFYKCYDI